LGENDHITYMYPDKKELNEQKQGLLYYSEPPPVYTITDENVLHNLVKKNHDVPSSDDRISFWTYLRLSNSVICMFYGPPGLRRVCNILLFIYVLYISFSINILLYTIEYNTDMCPKDKSCLKSCIAESNCQTNVSLSITNQFSIMPNQQYFYYPRSNSSAWLDNYHLATSQSDFCLLNDERDYFCIPSCNNPGISFTCMSDFYAYKFPNCTENPADGLYCLDPSIVCSEDEMALSLSFLSGILIFMATMIGRGVILLFQKKIQKRHCFVSCLFGCVVTLFILATIFWCSFFIWIISQNTQIFVPVLKSWGKSYGISFVTESIKMLFVYHWILAPRATKHKIICASAGCCNCILFKCPCFFPPFTNGDAMRIIDVYHFSFCR